MSPSPSPAKALEVVCPDFSEPMLAVAPTTPPFPTRQIPTRAPVHLLRGDAQHIPFPDASFDIVTISYGLRNLADWQLGLREMRRVARPGARLLILDFGKPDHALWRAPYFFLPEKFSVPLYGPHLLVAMKTWKFNPSSPSTPVTP